MGFDYLESCISGETIIDLAQIKVKLQQAVRQTHPHIDQVIITLQMCDALLMLGKALTIEICGEKQLEQMWLWDDLAQRGSI